MRLHVAAGISGLFLFLLASPLYHTYLVTVVPLGITPKIEQSVGELVGLSCMLEGLLILAYDIALHQEAHPLKEAREALISGLIMILTTAIGTEITINLSIPLANSLVGTLIGAVSTASIGVTGQLATIYVGRSWRYQLPIVAGTFIVTGFLVTTIQAIVGIIFPTMP